jgi:integrase/recombinase XerD
MRKCLSEEELQSLMSTPKRLRDRLMIRFLYVTGLRVGELVSLTVGDLDFAKEEITIRHAKCHPEGRTVPLTDKDTKLMLVEYLGNRREGPLFMSNKRNAMSRRQVERLVANYGVRVGIDRDRCHPHVLRHTHAIDALNAGIDLRTLRDNLGHTDLETTQIYLASATELEERKRKYRELFGVPRPAPKAPEFHKSYFDSFIVTDYPA